jgi:phosphatidylinositol glycan class C protein
LEGCPIFEGIVNRVKWERVLWKKQEYADNFVPVSFLECLVNETRSEEVRNFSVWPVIASSMAVAQQLSLVVLQGILLMPRQDLAAGSKSTVFPGDGIVHVAIAMLVILGSLVWFSFGREIGPSLWPPPVGNLCWLGLGTARALFPQLKGSFLAPGTTHTCGVVLAIFHLVSFDYPAFSRSYLEVGSNGKTVFGAPALHAAMGATLALLPESSHNLDSALLALGFFIFELSPEICLAVSRASPTGHAALTALIVLTPGAVLAVWTAEGNRSSSTCLMAFVAVLILVCGISPWGFCWAHRYKVRRNGPWEIAKVEQEHPSLM